MNINIDNSELILKPIESSDIDGIMIAINEKPEDLINAMPWIKINRKIKPQIINFVLESFQYGSHFFPFFSAHSLVEDIYPIGASNQT